VKRLIWYILVLGVLLIVIGAFVIPMLAPESTSTVGVSSMNLGFIIIGSLIAIAAIVFIAVSFFRRKT